MSFSFLFQAEIEQASENTVERQSTPGVSKKIGEKWGGGEREGVRGGEKRNRLRSNSNILPNSIRPRTGSNSAI